MYVRTQNDLDILKSRHREMELRVTLLNSTLQPLEDMQGVIVSGSLNLTADSPIRRTCSFTLFAKDKHYKLDAYARIWLDKFVRLELVLQNARQDRQLIYPLGIFVFDSCSSVYAATDKYMSISCSDLMSMLNGTQNGQIAASSMRIPAGQNLTEAIKSTLQQFAKIPRQPDGTVKMRIGVVGQYSCLEGKYSDYLENRKENPDWDKVPYDLEFSSGATVYDVMNRMVTLYPGYEMFFDSDGTFVVQMIPTGESEEMVLPDELLHPLVLSESVSTDLTAVRNCVRIYGKSIAADRFSETCTLSGGVYTAALTNFSLTSGVTVGVKIPAENTASGFSLNAGGTGALPIVEMKTQVTVTDAVTGAVLTGPIPPDANVKTTSKIVYAPIPVSTLKANTAYCFRYRKDATGAGQWLFLGQFAIEGFYQDDNPKSPFSVSRLGERLLILTEGNTDHIDSTTLANQRAQYETWQRTRLLDSLTLETVLIPWLDVNQKLEYRKQGEQERGFYLTKSIRLDFSGTMSITMVSYYPLYSNIIN